MAKKHYKFNPRTLTYEVITLPFRIRFYRMLRKVLIGIILALIVNFIFSFFFYTPKIAAIKQHNSDLVIKYDLLKSDVRISMDRINAIKHRDSHVYRAVFGTDTIDMPYIYQPFPMDHYSNLQGDMYSSLMTDLWMDLDMLARYLYGESMSFDQLQDFALKKDAMAESIPAIWPMDKNKIHRGIGAFGMRKHPILRRYIMHDGMDLGGPKGSPIYATGNGQVTFDTGVKSGYGKQILIDHGYGYKTRYAHLSKINVTPGQYVKRGEVIGLLGNTGRSTGPHLHYEVIYMGKPQNPINFISRDMKEEDLQKIIDAAKSTTYEM